MLLPYLTGERSPHWRNDLSATLHGLKLIHGRAEVARAALEAVAFSLVEIWELMGSGSRVYSTGGLASSPLWNALLTDMLDVPVQTTDAADASAIGAALLGHGEGTVLEVRRLARVSTVVNPSEGGAAPLRDARHRWQALYARLYG